MSQSWRFEEASERARLGIDKVEAIGRAYLAFAHELPHFFDACARFEACTPSGDVSSPSMQCLEAGDRVHEHVVAAILQGQKDGSIRTDLGDPMIASIALWGFSHGLLQIAMNKAQVLAHQGIAVPKLVEQSIAMFRLMLTP